MDAPELKPCPFCGERVEMNDYTDKPACAWVMIHRCKVLGPIKIEYGSGEKLAEVWNTRAEDHLMIEKDAEIERLRVALETLVSMEGGIYSDVSSAHNGRIGAAEWMREEDRDFRADLRNAFGAARAALGGDNG